MGLNFGLGLIWVFDGLAGFCDGMIKFNGLWWGDLGKSGG